MHFCEPTPHPPNGTRLARLSTADWWMPHCTVFTLPLDTHLGVRLVPFLLLSNPISRLSWRITTRATAPRIWRIISLTLDESDGQASRVCTKHSLHELVSASFLPLLIVFVVSFLLFPPIFCFLFCLTVYQGYLLRRRFVMGEPTGTGQHGNPDDKTAEYSSMLSQYWCHF